MSAPEVVVIRRAPRLAESRYWWGGLRRLVALRERADYSGSAMAEDLVASFCRRVRARTAEHRAAMSHATSAGLASVAVSILRMEVDSLVRTIFLLSNSEGERRRLLSESARGLHWMRPSTNGKMKRITDRMMVDLAQQLHGWTESVYRFGCAFIHLSNLHDYGVRDPLLALSVADRRTVLRHIRTYHGGPHVPDTEVTLTELVPFFPRILAKIASNLESYLKALETGCSLTP